MITIEETTLKELILRSEPDFLTQIELEMNNYGYTKQLKAKWGEDSVWVWNKERIRNCDKVELTYLVLKIVE